MSVHNSRYITSPHTAQDTATVVAPSTRTVQLHRDTAEIIYKQIVHHFTIVM